jgi:hypothetical protein
MLEAGELAGRSGLERMGADNLCWQGASPNANPNANPTGYRDCAAIDRD